MDTTILVITAAQIGMIGTVSALVAPIVFRALDPGAAGAFLRRLFPRYFVTAAVVALAAAVLAAASGLWGEGLLLAGDAAAFAVARALVPRINAAKDRGDARFARLHRASTLLNGLGLILAMLALGSLVVG